MPSHTAERDSQPPNGWRLSGDGGEADGVRCSRGLGVDTPLRTRSFDVVDLGRATDKRTVRSKG